MGIHIYLQVLPHRIRSTEWIEAYDESLRLLQSHRSGLMAVIREAAGDLERLVYTRQLEAHLDDPERRHWGVVGDMTSKRSAESFVVYRDPGHYRIGEKHGDEIDEILAAVHEELRTDRESESTRSCCVFGGKTQGEPYHVPVLAAGLLFESRFPGAALVFGEFDRAEGEQAAAWAGNVLGRQIPLPVLLEPRVMFDRLAPHYAKIDLLSAVDGLCRLPRQEVLASLLEVAGREDVRRWLTHNLATCSSPHEGDAVKTMASWLDLTGDVSGLCQMCCRDPLGPRFSALDFVDVLVGSLAPGADSLQLLDAVRPPEGTPHTDASLMAGALLDPRFPERHPPFRADEDQLMGVLCRCFPEHGAEVRSIVRTTSRKKATETAKLEPVVAHFMERMNGRTGRASFDDLIALEAVKELPEQQQMELRGLGIKLLDLLREAEEGETAWFLEGPADGLRRRMTALCSEIGLTLTEDAWENIEREHDVGLLQYALVLVSVSSRELQFWETRKAVIESPALLRDLYEISIDPVLAAETRVWLEQQQERVS